MNLRLSHIADAPKTGSRNSQIDTMRFLLILSIYIFHFETAGGRLYRFCATFHTPGFFLMSGFWALNHKDWSVGRFAGNAVRKYLFPWFVWVLIYTGFYAIQNSYGAKESLTLFVRYFSAVRATGIWGMWFTPAFFFVNLTYFFLTKIMMLFLGDRKWVLLRINCVLCFMIYFLFRYVFGNPQGLLFSLSFVPEYLFYYSLGAAGYYWMTVCSDQLWKTSACKKFWVGIVSVASLLYMILVYFGKDSKLWGWTAETVFTFLPEVLTACAALIAISFAAKLISCDFTARIGRCTLGLCHAEAFIKKTIVMLGSLLGLSIQAKTPIEVIVFSVIALAVGAYAVIPMVDELGRRILKINSCDVVQKT